MRIDGYLEYAIVEPNYVIRVPLAINGAGSGGEFIVKIVDLSTGIVVGSVTGFVDNYGIVEKYIEFNAPGTDGVYNFEIRLYDPYGKLLDSKQMTIVVDSTQPMAFPKYKPIVSGRTDTATVLDIVLDNPTNQTAYVDVYVYVNDTPMFGATLTVPPNEYKTVAANLSITQQGIHLITINIRPSGTNTNIYIAHAVAIVSSPSLLDMIMPLIVPLMMMMTMMVMVRMMASSREVTQPATASPAPVTQTATL